MELRFTKWLENYMLEESMSIYVQDFDQSDIITDLDDLGNYLKKKVIYPIWYNQMTEEERKEVRNGGSAFHSTIAPDGCYYSGECQTLNFYSAGWGERTDKVLQGIKYYLDELGVKYGPVKKEKSGQFDSNVHRFDILQMPKAEDHPPQLNLSNENARLIFGDMLGYEGEPGGFFNLDARDLLMRIEKVNMDQMDLHSRDPYSAQQTDGPKILHGGYSSSDIKQRLDIVKKIAQWAITNHYDKINVV